MINDYPDSPRPTCCPDGNSHVVFWVNIGDNEFRKDGEETWMCEAFSGIKFCPFCGTPMPKVEKTNPKRYRKVCTVIDGGYYCDTCGDRLQCCECHVPAELYRIVP